MGDGENVECRCFGICVFGLCPNDLPRGGKRKPGRAGQGEWQICRIGVWWMSQVEPTRLGSARIESSQCPAWQYEVTNAKLKMNQIFVPCLILCVGRGKAFIFWPAFVLST